MQYIHIAKNRSQLVNPKVAAIMGKTECKKYIKAVWKSMFKKQQMQVNKLCKQHAIEPITRQTSAKARIAALGAQLGVNSQPKEGDVKKKERETPIKPAYETKG